jgi:crossover junction endodeoxyribonuclease RusA
MIALPFPDKILWPNGRGHRMAKHRAFQKHKQWAYWGTLDALPADIRMVLGPIRLRYTITPKTAHPIDRDNCIAAMKAYQDGIALALGVDDSVFETPEIAFAEPKKPGGVEVSL